MMEFFVVLLQLCLIFLMFSFAMFFGTFLSTIAYIGMKKSREIIPNFLCNLCYLFVFFLWMISLVGLFLVFFAPTMKLVTM